MPVDRAWAEVRAYQLRKNNPEKVAKAEADPKLKMAMVFRRHLFLCSQWARDGNGERKADYQIWCGPAMGAFNDWVRGSFLESLANRGVAQIGKNLLEGAAVIQRAQQLRGFGVPVKDRRLRVSAAAPGLGRCTEASARFPPTAVTTRQP